MKVKIVTWGGLTYSGSTQMLAGRSKPFVMDVRDVHMSKRELHTLTITNKVTISVFDEFWDLEVIPSEVD